MSFLTSLLTKTSASRVLQQFSHQYFHSLTKPTMGVQLLAPIEVCVEQTAGFKVKGRLRRRCKDCYFVRRQERLFVICETHPRHKQMQMVKDEKNTWMLSHATQGKVRPW